MPRPRFRLPATALAIALVTASAPASARTNGPDPAVHAVLEALQTGRGKPAAFSATYAVDERYHGLARRVVYAMRYRQTPPATRLEVVASNEQPVGLRVRACGGPSVDIRLPGVLGWMPLRVPARSKEARNLLGLYPDEVTPVAFIAALRDPRSHLSRLADRQQDGQRLTMIAITGPRCLLPGATLTVGTTARDPFPYYTAISTADGGFVQQCYHALVERPVSASELAI